MNTKKWYFSKTIIISVLQGVAGILLAFAAQDSTLNTVGWFAMSKSVLDAAIRLLTSAPLE